MEQARQTQADSMESLKNSVSMVAVTREVGVATATKLGDQTDQLHRINDTNDRISAVVDRSNWTLRGIGRRIMTDKCMGAIIVLLIIAIVAIVASKYTT